MAKAHIGFYKSKKISYELNDLTRHALVVGTTGSGKTVMCKVLVEEALSKGIPVIAVDPKGDIGGLSVIDKDFDFRPFGGKGKAGAIKTASKYQELLGEQGVKMEFESLKKVSAKIYTPKSSNGVQLAFMPSLSAPKNFSKLEEDHSVVAGFVEPVCESVLQLAGITGKAKEKALSLISSILIHYWREGKDLSIERLVEQVVSPPFELIGSLPLEDFMNVKERKKLASSINTLLTSPSKKAWRHGRNLDVKEMLKPYTLSIFDLRFTGSNNEKQFAIEILLQEIYKFLLSRGGSEKLKFVLYIDEIAGFIPPPPSNPGIKKTLELLVRQARAFGLGIMLATQSPGDVDYKLFGNLGTRFIGRLRTDQDLEKVATGAGLPLSALKKEVSWLSTGEFYYNNAVRNKSMSIKTRWVLSYHSGPLRVEEIKWVNTPSLAPDKEPLRHEERKLASDKKPRAREYLSAASLIEKKKETIALRTTARGNVLSELIRSVKNHSDNTQLKVELGGEGVYVPHLRIVVEPRKLAGLSLSTRGPYIFDLTTKIIPMENYLKNMMWSQYAPKEIVLEKPRRSIKHAFDYALKDARQSLRKKYFVSTITSVAAEDLDTLVKKNNEMLLATKKKSVDMLNRKLEAKKKPLEEKIRSNKKKSSSMKLRVTRHKAKRVFKKIVSGNKYSKSTKEMRHWSKRAKQLESENKRLKAKIEKLTKEFSEKKRKIEDKYFEKARKSIKQKTFIPKKKDLVIHATILLVSARKTRA